MDVLRFAPRASALLLSCTALTATAGEPGASGRKQESSDPLAAGYRCRIGTVRYQGRDESTLTLVQSESKRVWVRGAAYRVEIEGLGGAATINPGDGTGAEYVYHPVSRQAMLSPATLIWWYRKQHPQAAGAGPRVPPPPPRLTALRRYSAGDLRQELGINPSLKVRDGGKDTVAGRQCRVLIQEYDHMVYSTGRPDPTSHTTRRMSVSVPGDLVLREVVVTRFAGDTPPRPLVVRETTSVRDLVVGSPFPDHLFRLPPGINCTVPVDYTLPLPPGVRAERRAGFGATVIGSSAPKASGPGAK